VLWVATKVNPRYDDGPIYVRDGPPDVRAASRSLPTQLAANRSLGELLEEQASRYQTICSQFLALLGGLFLLLHFLQERLDGEVVVVEAADAPQLLLWFPIAY
jgi:hypothetical protein